MQIAVSVNTMKALAHSINTSATQSYMEGLPGFVKVYADSSTLFLPESTGTGFSKILMLEDGLHVHNMDFNLQSNFEFIRLARKDGEEKSFQLYYFPECIDFNVSIGNDDACLSPVTLSNIIMLSNDLRIHGRFEKKGMVKVIVISFSISWLKRNGFESVDCCKSFFTARHEPDKGIMLMQYPGMADQELVRFINKTLVPGNEFLFPIKANCLKLIDLFFESVEKRRMANLKQHQTNYFFQMVEVEKRITACLNEDLPVIKTLSKEFLMSESTLKKHFRLVYGKNIYEYYLDKKMHLAREMLLKATGSVSQVAYSLGYDKVSGFSKAFRKTFNILPSQLRQSI